MISCRTNYCSNKEKILRLLVRSRKPFDAGANFRDVKLPEGKIIHPCTFSLAPSIPPFLPLSIPPPLPHRLKLKPAPKLLPACLPAFQSAVFCEKVSAAAVILFGEEGKCDRTSRLAQQTHASTPTLSSIHSSNHPSLLFPPNLSPAA